MVYGPSPLNAANVEFFPRLSAALTVAMAQSPSKCDVAQWEAVKREAFFVVDALESASCVLDNHLVYTFLEEKGHAKDKGPGDDSIEPAVRRNSG